MSLLNTAIKLAVDAHSGQFDKAGKPYIFHPCRVMAMGRTTDEQIVGVLHDVLEDSPKWHYLSLVELFGHVVADAVWILTRRVGETYEQFIYRVAKHRLARRVKLNDLRDNLAPDRRDGLSANLEARYLKAQNTLQYAEDLSHLNYAKEDRE